METHISYLDELILAVKRKSISNSKNNEFPTKIPEDGDSESIALIEMVVNKLTSMHRNDALNSGELFSKSLKLMDLLLTSKPYLLIHKGLKTSSTNDSSDDKIGIVRLLGMFLQLSVLNINNPHRIWLIRKKVGEWCVLTHQLYGGKYRLIQSTYIETLLETSRRNLAKVISGTCKCKGYLQDLRFTYILCYWLNARPDIFKSSLLLLDSSSGTSRWTLKFQKLIRFILYLFDSTQLSDNNDYVDLQISFLALSVEQLINNTILNARNTPDLRTMEQFRFCLYILHRFLKMDIIVQNPYSVSFAKSLLRVYSLCFSRSLRNQVRQPIFHMFVKELPILQKSWIENLDLRINAKATNTEVADPVALRAIILVFFDIQRRTASPEELSYDEKSGIRGEKESLEMCKLTVSTPFTEVSTQLEGFRVIILNSFKKRDFMGRLSGEIDNLESDLLTPSKSLADTFDEISTSIKSCFTVKNTRKIMGWIGVLSKMACYESHNKTIKGISKEGPCRTCDANHSANIYLNIDSDRPDCTTDSHTYAIVVKHFLSNPELANFNEGLLAGILICLQRIFSHFQPPALQNNITGKRSQVFDFVWSCFLNSNRYIRILASRLIPLWNITDIHNSDCENTFILANLLPSSNNIMLTETVIKTWTHLTLTTSGNDFEILLLKLLEFLASKDPAIYTMAEYQIRNLANIMGKTPYQLISPILPLFLREMASVFKEEKKTFLKLTNIMGCTPQSVLEENQAFIIPYAVLQQKSDVFGEVVKMMENNNETSEYLTNRLLKSNAKQICAVALVRYGFFNIGHIKMLFRTRLPNFPILPTDEIENDSKSNNSEESFISDTMQDYYTIAEVAKLYLFSETSDEKSKDNERKVLGSMRYLLMNFSQDPIKGAKYKNIDDWNETQEKLFQKALSYVFLGIFQAFSVNLHDTNGGNSNYEKLRVINGMSFLVQYSSIECVISGLAQISICLQTAMEINEISYTALRCWHLLIKKLEDQELSAVIGGLIAYILQKWPTFNTKMKKLAHELLDDVINEKSALIFQINPYIVFSLIQERDFDFDIIKKNNKFAKHAGKVISTTNLIPIFVQNLQSNNLYVVKQTLDDIKIFLERKQVDGREGALNLSRNDSSFNSLLSTLLNTAYKFRVMDNNISKMCSKHISLIGMRDLTKVGNISTTLADRVCNFNDTEQTINFLIWVTNDILVPSFWGSENPNKQLFVALVMQESLKYCGLHSGEIDQVTYKIEDHPDRLAQWNKFNTISKATLTPLLYSRYEARPSDYAPLSYPIYDVNDGYTPWIKTLTLDLIKMGTLQDTKHPLQIFASLMKGDDGYISNFLLPYIVIDILIKAHTNRECEILAKNVVIEFNHVFQKDLNDLNHLQMDSQKMCYTSIFRVLEYGRKWVTEYKRAYNERNGTHIIKEEAVNEMLSGIEKFLNSIPLSLLAQRSMETNSFERSALYFEQCKRQQDENVNKDETILRSLQRSYEEIGDIDSVDGILKTFSSRNLLSKIDELQYSNNWKMAQDCFSVLATYDIPTATTKMMKSMYDHQLYSNLLDIIPPVLANSLNLDSNIINEYFAYGLETTNLVGKKDSLNFWIEKIESLEKISDPNIVLQYNMAKALLHVSQGHRSLSLKYIDKCYETIGTHFTTSATATTLVKKQTLLMKLHGMYDVDLLAADIDESRHEQNREILDARLEKVGGDFIPNYYLMSIRKSFDILKGTKLCQDDLFKTYLQMSRLARDNGRLDIASDSLMKCLKEDNSPIELEFAEILWKQGENDRALKLVQEIHFKYENSENVDKKVKARVLLKYTEWLDLSNNSASAQIIDQYKLLLKLCPQWYQPYYSFGQYYSSLIEKRNAEGLSSDGTWEFKSISYFLAAFAQNAIHVRENLPKVVTFWLDISDAAVRNRTETTGIMLKRASEKICEYITDALKRCPIYIWYSVLTQLLSRLLHSHERTALLIKEILFQLTIEYPTHMLWYITVLQNSTAVSYTHLTLPTN